MKRAELISVDLLFENYRRWILNQNPFDSISAELESISESRHVHRRLVEKKSDDVLGRFGSFADAFDVSTAMPLVLYLSTEGVIGTELEAALAMIESFILRRDICGLNTKNYNRFFVDAIDKLRKSDGSSLQKLHTILSAGTIDISRWPSDQEFKDAWLGRDQYRASRQPRLRHLFEKIEQRKRTALSEEIEIKSQLTVEHIMPQKWRLHWPVPGFEHVEDGEFDFEKAAREVEREEHINEIGNLTLVTHVLNATLSNEPFEVKMPAIRSHAALALNRELEKYDGWDEHAILHRGAALFEIARKIWLGPQDHEVA